MNALEIITQYLDEYEGVDISASLDANNARKRRRCLGWVNRVTTFVDGFRSWSWMFGQDTLVIAAGTNEIVVPTDFDGPSTQNRVFREGNREPLTYVSPGRMLELRAYGSVSDHYSVYDELFKIPYIATTDINHPIYYRRKNTRYLDNLDPMRIPDRYLDLVIMPGVVALGQEGKLDARGVHASAFRAGLAQMCARENPMQEGITMLPMRIQGGS